MFLALPFEAMESNPFGAKLIGEGVRISRNIYLLKRLRSGGLKARHSKNRKSFRSQILESRKEIENSS